jgi:hypothetical protein
MSDRQKSYVPQEIDDIEDRMGAVHPLDFENSEDEPHGRAGDRQGRRYAAERVREAGMSGGETLGSGVHEDGISEDDLSQETLYDESGARDADEYPEESEGGPLDKELTTVDASQIGGGSGLDEAELGRINPLDGKPWDGEEDSLAAEEEVDLDEDELAGDAPLNSAPERTRGGRETPGKKG